MDDNEKSYERKLIWRNILIAAVMAVIAAGIVIYKNQHKDTKPTLKQLLQEKKTRDSLGN